MAKSVIIVILAFLLGVMLTINVFMFHKQKPKQAVSTVGKPISATLPTIKRDSIDINSPEGKDISKRIFNKVYGANSYAKYGVVDDFKFGWKLTDKDMEFIVEPYKIDAVQVGAQKRIYLLGGGTAYDGVGLNTSHAASGIMAGVIYDMSADTIIAMNKEGFASGAWGGCGTASLVQLSKDGYFGWRHENGDVHQGWAYLSTTIVAPRGKKVVGLWGTTVSDEEMGDEEYVDTHSFMYIIDSSSTDKVFPIITKMDDSTTAILKFNSNTWAYK